MESTSLTAPIQITTGRREAGFGADDGGLAQCLIAFLHEEREAADRARRTTLMAAHA